MASTSTKAEKGCDDNTPAREFVQKKSSKQSEQSSPQSYQNEEMDNESQGDVMCRYCFCGEEEGPLISPCKCKGGQKYVHLKCLRRWQRMVLVSQPTHPSYYEDDVRHHKCNVCLSKFSCPPPKRVELMESFTGAEIAALVREGCIIASSPAFSNDISDKFDRLSPLEREISGLDHWYKGVFLITSVEREPDDFTVPVNLESQEQLDAVREQFDEDNKISLSGKSMVLIGEGSLAGKQTKENIREALRELTAPALLVLKPAIPGDHGDDRIEAVNIGRRIQNVPNTFEKQVRKVVMKVKKAYKNEEVPLLQVTHHIGGPCSRESLAACLVFLGSGRGWKICDNLETAIHIAYKQLLNPLGEFRRGQSVELHGLRASTHLNGQQALTLNFDDESRRWCVRLFDGSGKKVLPKNLRSYENENGHVMCFWGSAIWTRTQLLGEVARGSWGLCCASIVDLIKPIEGKWESIQDRLAFSPITEMSEDYIRQAREEMNQVREVAPTVEQGGSEDA